MELTHKEVCSLGGKKTLKVHGKKHFKKIRKLRKNYERKNNISGQVLPKER